MRITRVEYSKTFNLGNYQSAKIGFEAEVEGYETAPNHLDAADVILSSLVRRVEMCGAEALSGENIKRAKSIEF